MIAILIPAYQPNQLLKQLVDELLALKLQLLIVIDDGSDSACEPLFLELEQAGCHVLHHPTNQGKGATIKTGIAYAVATFPELSGVVTCDADGQHRPADILRVADALKAQPQALILGTRDFSQSDVPKTSRMGNRFSAMYFKLTTGITCHDTQTGLRGIPRDLNALALEITENRYDYEMTFLTRAAKSGVPLVTVDIATVYLNKNAASHFRPFVDSIRIYREPLKFTLASILSAAVDLGIFSLLTRLLSGTLIQLVFLATIGARITSGLVNFILNRRFSFRVVTSVRRQFLRYLLLYGVQLSLSICFVYLLAFLPIHLTLIKLFVDFVLFLGSFFIQKNWVFKQPSTRKT
jgi:glycosyltransferase involved in cell wall biosynthesis